MGLVLAAPVWQIAKRNQAPSVLTKGLSNPNLDERHQFRVLR
jgi:hypothetical protein